MFDLIKNKIALFIVNKHLKEKKSEVRSFNNLFKNATSFLIIMPEDEKDFHHAILFLKDMDAEGKKFSLYMKDFRISLLPQKYRSVSIGYGELDITKFILPTKELRDKLSFMKFNLVIDLNRKDNLFCSYSANLVNSEFKIGIKKKNSDKYYNLQISDTKDISEIFYKNFLNCLLMF